MTWRTISLLKLCSGSTGWSMEPPLVSSLLQNLLIPEPAKFARCRCLSTAKKPSTRLWKTMIGSKRTYTAQSEIALIFNYLNCLSYSPSRLSRIGGIKAASWFVYNQLKSILTTFLPMENFNILYHIQENKTQTMESVTNALVTKLLDNPN